jgi:hypothetical protein
MNNYNTIFDDILKELEYAHERWGDEFDKKNTLNDWVTFINMYACDAAKLEYSSPESLPQSKKESRKKLIKAAGLCISAIKQLDSNPGNNGFALRHYDK